MKNIDDELINIVNERNKDQQNASTLSKQEQARKVTSYRGINRDNDDTRRDGEEYFVTSSRDSSDSKHGNNTKKKYITNYYVSSSPRDARLQRIRELKKKQQVEDHEPSTSSPPAKEEHRSERKQVEAEWMKYKEECRSERVKQGRARGPRRLVD